MVPARTLRLFSTVVLALAALTACGRREDARPAPKPLPAAFVREQQAWRDARVRELTRPDGWTSLVGLHWLDPGAHYAGRARDNGIRLAMGPPQLGMFDVRDGRVRFVPHPRTALTIDGRPARPGLLRSDDDPAGPSVIGFDDGRGIATVIHRGTRFALRVKHADAPTRTGFRGLQYWPGGPDWVVDARFVPNPPGTTLDVVNIVGLVEPTPNPGYVEFERRGNRYRLQALANDDGGLFLVFADGTSGHGSYGAGRFLDTPPPSGGRVRIDFNHAYNPPCAFTPYATCPLPPDANRLPLAITAGEKAYGSH